MKNERKRNRSISLALGVVLLFAACHEPQKQNATESARRLPHYGQHDVEFKKTPSGEMVPDTEFYQLPKFSFINENGRVVSHHDYENKIFVADFFFSTCKTICPLLSSQMVRVQEALKQEGLTDRVMLLSHTVDPEHDLPDTLKAYAQKIGADTSIWNFVTGTAEDLYWQAEEGYELTAFPSDSADGGFFHTDKITLVDRNRYIRGYYDGTSTKSVDQLISDIKILVNETE